MLLQCLGLILLLGGLLSSFLLSSAAWCETPGSERRQLCSRAGFRILLPGPCKRFLDRLGRCRARGFLNFACDAWAFGGNFLPEGRAVELKKAFDFVGGIVLIVRGNELFVQVI